MQSRNLAGRVSPLLLAYSALAFGSQARLLLEDGKPLPSSPLVLPGTTCTIERIYGRGQKDYHVGKYVPVAPMEDGVGMPRGAVIDGTGRTSVR